MRCRFWFALFGLTTPVVACRLPPTASSHAVETSTPPYVVEARGVEPRSAVDSAAISGKIELTLKLPPDAPVADVDADSPIELALPVATSK